MSGDSEERAQARASSALAIPTAQVVHHVAGRCRLLVPSMRGNATYFERAAAVMSDASLGVLAVRVGATTGSIVIGYAGRFERIARTARKRGVFHIARGPVQTATPAPRSEATVMPPKTAAPWLALALGGLAIYRLAEDPFMFAMSALCELARETSSVARARGAKFHREPAASHSGLRGSPSRCSRER